jgi:hypothetical protein
MRLVTLTLATIIFAAMPAHAQTTESLVPEVGEPGDVISIVGTGLQDTTDVMFTAIVGGFVGYMSVVVPAANVTPTRVEVQVPQFGSFLPPPPLADGEPIGLVTALDALGQPIAGQLEFWYLEITWGDVQTLGKGSTLPHGAKLAISFEPHGDQPVAGNPDLQLKLVSAPAGAQAFLLVGVPAVAPYPPVGTGLLVVDLTLPWLAIGPVPVAPSGSALLPAPVPAAADGITVALQWILKEPGTGKLMVSNAFVALL